MGTNTGGFSLCDSISDQDVTSDMSACEEEINAQIKQLKTEGGAADATNIKWLQVSCCIYYTRRLGWRALL